MDYLYERFAQATHRLTDFTIPSFDGSGDIEDWFRRYEDLATARRWGDDCRKEQLTTFFSGSASQWLAVRRTTSSGDGGRILRSSRESPWEKLS